MSVRMLKTDTPKQVFATNFQEVEEKFNKQEYPVDTMIQKKYLVVELIKRVLRINIRNIEEEIIHIEKKIKVQIITYSYNVYDGHLESIKDEVAIIRRKLQQENGEQSGCTLYARSRAIFFSHVKGSSPLFPYFGLKQKVFNKSI